MKTYNTYQEAKIANPECEISISMSGIFAASDYVANIALSGCVQGWNKCNPADHCMTVEEFLSDGRKGVGGDWFMIGNGNAERLYNAGVYSFNAPSAQDCNIFILRSAALENQMNIDNLATQTPEEKEVLDLIDTTPHQYEMSKFSGKQRTKVEYVKCEFNSFSDVYSAILDNGDIYGYEVDGYRPRCYLDESGSFIWRYKERCASHSGLQGVDISQLYRRIETPMTEREEFVDAFELISEEVANAGSDWSFACVASAMFDSGKFKLVESNQ